MRLSFNRHGLGAVKRRQDNLAPDNSSLDNLTLELLGAEKTIPGRLNADKLGDLYHNML